MSFSELLGALDQDKKQDLLQALDLTLEISEEQEPLAPDGTVRASSINRFCPRHEAIRVKEKIVEKREFSAQTARIFAFGRAFEKWLRDTMFGNMGILIGKWMCNRCEFVPGMVDGKGLYAKPVKCCVCGNQSFSFKEVFAKDAASMIGGHNDGFLYWNGEYHILEVKTANDRNYTMAIKSGRPMDDHYAQTQIYMWLHNYSSACVLYYNKNTSQQHVFWVGRNLEFIKMFRERGYALREFFERDVMPGRICVDNKCPRAMDCALATKCFEEYP